MSDFGEFLMFTAIFIFVWWLFSSIGRWLFGTSQPVEYEPPPPTVYNIHVDNVNVNLDQSQEKPRIIDVN